MSEEKLTLKQERIKLFRDATANKRTYRTPHRSYFTTWILFDAGYRLVDSVDNYANHADAARKHYELYKWDGCGFGITCNYAMSKALGTNWYNYDMEADAISCVDQPVLHDFDEYREFIANPKKVIYEKWMTRKYPKFNDEMDVSLVDNAIKTRDEYFAANMEISKMADEYEVPGMSGGMAPINPLEYMIDYYTGIKGMPILMRRDPGLFREFCDALNDYHCEPMYRMLENAPEGPNMNLAFDGNVMLLAHSFLNEKQFDEYYWPYIGRGIRCFTDKNKTCHIQLQAHGRRFFDHLYDMQNGLLDLQPELDSPFEVRKLLPNMCLSAGVSLNKLGHDTPEVCADEARKILTELGDQGLILTQDKMGAYPNDCQRENLLAVCEVVQNFRR